MATDPLPSHDPAAASTPESDRGVTIIVPTFNREPFSTQSVQDLLNQDHSPIEIFVVDQSSEPAELPKLAVMHPDVVTYHHVSFRGVTRSRNFGWQHARYETIVYIDDDIRCPPEFVRGHVEALDAADAEIIAGGIDEPSRFEALGRVGYFNVATADTTRGWNSHKRQYVDHAPGGNFSLNRNVLRSVGGFDSALEVGAALYEETEFFIEARRLGFRIFFEPEVRLTHLVAPSGGNRVPDVTRFTYGMAYNRSLVIRRHTPSRSWPRGATAVAKMLVHRAQQTHSPIVFLAGMLGAGRGFVAGGHGRRCENGQAPRPTLG